MTKQEMCDRAKTGLRCISGEEVLCASCPYRMKQAAFLCWKGAAKEAIALLEVQEPRLMSLEEVLALNENTPVYIENADGLHGWDVFCGIEPETGEIMTGAPWALTEYWQQASYLGTWRCWTGEPTEKKMDDTGWD